MMHEKHVLHWVLWGAVAMGAVVACGAPSWDALSEVQVDARPGAEAAFAAHQNEFPSPEAAPERVKVLAVDEAGLPLPGVEIACHDVRTRTAADGRAECDVQAADGAWPIYVRAKYGADFGHARTAGHGEEVRVVVRSTVDLVGSVYGELPWTGEVVAIAESASGGELRAKLVNRTFRFRDRPAVRTFIRIEQQTSDGHTTMLGTAISEAGEPVNVATGENGTIEFVAATRGIATVRLLRVYVDRIERSPTFAAGKLSVSLAPGEHVLVLNDSDSRARAELKFKVEGGKATDLGRLTVE
jgi:hypothetical protein